MLMPIASIPRRTPIESPLEKAYFLDVDGTLLELASSPTEVHVPGELISTLETLSSRVGGAQDPEDPGVLVLSHLAGAAQELESAVLVNPYDIDDTAAGLERALSMSLSERIERWQDMIEVLRRNDIHVWRARFLQALQDAGAVQEPTVRVRP